MKRCLMVSYDLNSPGQNYDELIKWLESFETRWHWLDSFWLIVTDLDAGRVRDVLKDFIDPNDELLVIDVTNDTWASQGFSDEANNWLKQFIAA